MSDLRAPLKAVAPAPVDEVTVLRMWRAVGRRRARAPGGASPWRLRAVVAMAAVVAGAGIAVAAVRLEGRHDAGPLPGPLHRVGGAELASVAAPAGQPAPVALDDGSTILLAPGGAPAVGTSTPAVVSPVPAGASPVASAQGTGHEGGGPAGGGPSPAAREQWRALAQRGEFKEAYRAIAPGGVAGEAQGASVDDLLLLADVARLSGHPADAVAPLSRVVGAHDPRSPVAAFTLGRVQLDALGQASAAADTFARAIALGLPQGLREDAYVRVVEARARAGNREGARAAAAEYEARYPNGDRRAQVRAWVDRE